MTSLLEAWRLLLLVGVLSAYLVACGGEIVGIGNGGNRISNAGTPEDVAEALAEHAGTPRVSDDELAEIFSAIRRRATQGDPEAALIVLRVAQQQREADQE